MDGTQRVGDHIKVSKNVFDLPTVIEPGASHNDIGDLASSKFIFEYPGLGIGPIKNGAVVVGAPVVSPAENFLHDEGSFSLFGRGRIVSDGLTPFVFRPELLLTPLFDL